MTKLKKLAKSTKKGQIGIGPFYIRYQWSKYGKL